MLLLLVFILPGAKGADLGQSIGMEEFDRAARAYLDSYLPLEVAGEDFSAGARAILDTGNGQLTGAIRRAGRSGVLLLSVALLCALAGSVREELGGGGLDPVRLAGAAAITAIAVADVNALMGMGKQALEQMDTFSKVLLPTVTAACAATGQGGAAAARQGATLLFFSFLLALVQRLLLPMVYAYVAVSAARAALGNEGLKRVADLLKWAVTGLLSALLTVFVFYLTISGAIAGAADAVTQKAAKTVLSGMVPVVGSILSDAAETVVAGAGVLKGTIGAVGLLVVLAICLAPFLQLGCHYLIYKCAAALTATVTPGSEASLINAIGSAFALVLGMTGGGGMILYAALITSIKAVSGG